VEPNVSTLGQDAKEKRKRGIEMAKSLSKVHPQRPKGLYLGHAS
jgi:hypothetical protein